jgi:2-polyprenyl-3-methyl-5-hydroxy-6-metoxy-1,4-benzoquinol methylase
VDALHAIDISEKMVEIGRGKAAEAGLSNLTFTVGTLEETREPDASCDAILGLNILHLVPDLECTIDTVARMLKPGGHFFSSTICLKNLRGNLRWLGLATRVLPLLPTVRSFSVEQLETMLRGAGFGIEERLEQRPGVVFLVAVRQ